LDFWAPWCGPCKTLGPLLEEEAVARKGAFILAKLDTEANPELASAFQIQAIPTVMVLDQGRPIDGFQGALAKKELGEFLDKFATKQTPAALEDARKLQLEGKFDEAIALLEENFEELLEDEGARLLQTRLLLDLGRDDEAREFFDALEDDLQESEEGRAIRARLDLNAAAEDLDSVSDLEAAFAADPSSANRFALAKALIADGQNEPGLEHLLELVRTDRAFEDDAARKLMLETFEALGPEDAVANDYRYQLQMALFV
jgi:putative thioredoxin